MENSSAMKSSQKIHLSSFLLMSVTDVVQEPGQSAGATENFGLTVRCFANDTDCSILYYLLLPRHSKVCCPEQITYNSIKLYKNKDADRSC